MRTAVIGAGVGGLTAAYRLTQAGNPCDVYERWPGLGGQAATLDVGAGDLLERYYHVLFLSDRHIRDLFTEIGLGDELEWHSSRVAIFSHDRVHPFTSPADLIRFTPMSATARLRMGMAFLWLQYRHREVGPLENETARAWVERAMGQQAYEEIWGPLLRAKFADRADEISMAWLWSKLTLRRRITGEQTRKELLGYPRGSWEPLFTRLSELIERQRGRVFIDKPVARIASEGAGFTVTAGAPGSFRRGQDPRAFETLSSPERYDAVLATVPSDIFASLLEPALAEQLHPDFRRRSEDVEYTTALCLLLETDRPLTSYYWTSVCDPDVPFIGLVEHTNLVPPERYGGRRFLYVANYVHPDDPLLELDVDALLARYLPAMQRMNNAFSLQHVQQAWRFAEPAGQPVIPVSYQRRIPPLETGVPGLVLANTALVYPEDRGTNYAVRLADEAVEVILRRGTSNAPEASGHAVAPR